MLYFNRAGKQVLAARALERALALDHAQLRRSCDCAADLQEAALVARAHRRNVGSHEVFSVGEIKHASVHPLLGREFFAPLHVKAGRVQMRRL